MTDQGDLPPRVADKTDLRRVVTNQTYLPPDTRRPGEGPVKADGGRVETNSFIEANSCHYLPFHGLGFLSWFASPVLDTDVDHVHIADAALLSLFP